MPDNPSPEGGKRHAEFLDEAFWTEYAPIIFDPQRWAEVPRVADGITRLARLGLYGEEPDRKRGPGEGRGPRILDLCCGPGRITLELARRGFDAVGVDITEAYIRRAREAAAGEGLELEFIRADARSFTRPRFFDAALNLYTSFGYFADPGDDRRMVQNVYDSLKAGGVFIVETLGKEIAVRDFVKAEWFERAGYTVLTQYAPVDSWGGLQNRWVLLKDGGRIERTFVQRLYAGSELRRLLGEAGFSPVELYGDWDESPYDNNAATLIAAGKK
jgi:SAM-dependent methyltransferase